MKFSKGINNLGYGAFGHIGLYSIGYCYTRYYDPFLTSPEISDILDV
jgi:hypothetical protein